ncbi:MAG TPA: hypothetical protein VFW98_00375 [Gemmatimonadaceae bacterium]|nr:hypothetical protein [Gemmatimonadaceae bacterium]
MIPRHLALMAATTLAFAAITACARSPRSVPGTVAAGPLWRATLATPSIDTVTASPASRAILAAPITGSASVLPNEGGDTFSATITIAGAHPGGSYPWYVHLGTCDTQRGVVGETSMYPPVQVGSDGTGTATATIPFPVPNRSDWSVSVFSSASDIQTAIACGDLTKK